MILGATRDEAGHLAGKLSFDDSGRGGPEVALEIDAALPKEFNAARQFRPSSSR